MEAPEGSFTSVAAGGSLACGVRVDGSVVCWGVSDVAIRTLDRDGSVGEDG